MPLPSEGGVQLSLLLLVTKPVCYLLPPSKVSEWPGLRGLGVRVQARDPERVPAELPDRVEARVAIPYTL